MLAALSWLLIAGGGSMMYLGVTGQSFTDAMKYIFAGGPKPDRAPYLEGDDGLDPADPADYYPPGVGAGARGQDYYGTTQAATGPANMSAVLATIRSLESGGNYTARASGSDASGAYQFISSTWQGAARQAGIDVSRYPQAWQAPPALQDQVAAAYVGRILAANGGNVGAVPVTWYIGHVPTEGSTEWDTVPAAYAGNTKTPRQYQAMWLSLYRSKGGA